MRVLVSVSLGLLALTLPSSVDAAACDMTKLQPVLDSTDMLQCREVGNLRIPTASASPYYLGLQAEYLDKEACSSPSCGRAIAAIKALKTGECQMTTEICYRGGCGNVQVNLYSQHVDVVEAFCGGSLNYDGKGTEPPTPSTTRPSPVSETKTTAPSPSGSSSSTSTAMPTIYPQPTTATTPTTTSPVIPATTKPSETNETNETSSSGATDEITAAETVGSPENRTSVDNGTATEAPSPVPTAGGSGSGYVAMSSLVIACFVMTSLL